jgi:aspartate 1-decarboxylase
MRWLLRSKIHRATVTEADPAYVGSIAVDEELIKKAGFWSGEKVLVASVDTGARLETYLIPAEKGSGAIRMNGAAALLIKKGEKIIIMGFELSAIPIRRKNILVDENNKFVKFF